MRRIRPHLTYANVVSTIALFGLLAGGSAWAASQIGTNGIKDGAVTTKKLHDGAVTSKKLKDGAVGNAKLADASVGNAKLADASVGNAKLADASVGNAKLKDASVGTAKIKNDSVTGAKVNESSLGTVPKATIGTSPVAFGFVNWDGKVDAAHSRGLSNVNVVHDTNPGADPGTYCIKGLTGVRSAIVVADTDNGNHHATVRLGGTLCPGVSGVQFSVATFGLNAPEDDAFFIWFFN